MAATQEDKGNEVRAYRAKLFQELGFNLAQSDALADARGLNGFLLSHHDVRKYFEQGCTLELILRIFL